MTATEASKSVFSTWQAELKLLDDCPWPGPRPMNVDDAAALLVGRHDDGERFRQLVEQNRLIILDGESGVGKTSLLERGLIPELRAAGFFVASISKWADDPERDPASFLATQVRTAFEESAESRPDQPGRPESNCEKAWEHVRKFRENADFFGDMSASPDGTCVIVLDQFEELIRYAGPRAETILEAIRILNHHFQIKIVVSLRSEHLHRLRKLEREAKPYSLATFALRPVADEHAIDLIKAGNAGRAAIDDEAALVIADQWKCARQPRREDGPRAPGDEIGLLHLQALLYALNADDGTPPPISGHLDDFRQRVGAASKDPRALFTAALSAAVDVKLRRCVEASHSMGVNLYLIEGARQICARATRHLSSGGFKLHQDAKDLLGFVSGDELERLRLSICALAKVDLDRVAVEQNRLIDALLGSLDSKVPVDLAGGSWATLLDDSAVRTAVPDLASWIEARGALVSAADGDVVAGPVMGMSPAVVLVEECRRFALALAWMNDSFLVRLTTPTPGTTFVSLIHDRFSEGLARWGGDVLREPSGALKTMTSLEGSPFNWKRDGKDKPYRELTGQSAHRVIPNLRWKGAMVRADFSRIVFVNCDMSGAIFKDCSFNGVAFVNCLLDGAIFSDCTVVGAVDSTDTAWKREPSDFKVDVSIEENGPLVSAIAAFRGSPEGPGGALYSGRAGGPCVPWSERDSATPPDAKPPAGGLLIIGGKLSTLTVRNTSFDSDGTEDGAGVSFRHCAGSGLHIVEQVNEGNFEIHGCALRHVAVTGLHADLGAANGTASTVRPSTHIKFRISGSTVAQLWFGDNLTGQGTVANSWVVQAWNFSPDFDVSVTAGSHYHGLVGCRIVDATPMSAEERLVDVRHVDPDNEFRGRAQVMDYAREGLQLVARTSHRPPLETS